MPDTLESRLLVNRQNLPFALDQGIARKAALGVIVLATDHTIEHEWRQMLRIDGVAFYESRLWNSASITPETLREMEKDIAGASETDPARRAHRHRRPSPGPLGRDGDRRRQCLCPHPREPARHCGDDADGGRHRRRQGAGRARVALLTPYVDRINRMMRDYIEARGVEVPVIGSFNHENDNEVARIDGASIESAVLELGRHAAVDAVFVSCTSLRVVHLIEALEAKLGKLSDLKQPRAGVAGSLRLAGVTGRGAGIWKADAGVSCDRTIPSLRHPDRADAKGVGRAEGTKRRDLMPEKPKIFEINIASALDREFVYQ